jgi:CRISPR-associated endonuclease/helicase Cas3
MRPYHAALLGTDTLAVLDEAHLVPAFECLLQDIENGSEVFNPKDEPLRWIVPPFRLMSLSATGRGDRAGRVFRLSEKDFEHPVVSRRLSAAKRLFARELDRGERLAEVLASEAWRITGNGSRALRCIVYCDSREEAVRAKKELEHLSRSRRESESADLSVDTELFVGGRRIFERQDAADRLESLGFIASKSTDRNRPAFLFATSAAEVGVDLNADCMVCDLAHWERMVQRLGRLNRRGDAPGGADIVVVLEAEPEADSSIREALSKQPEERNDKEKKTAEKYETALARYRAKRGPIDVLRQNGCDVSLEALLRLKDKAKETPGLRQMFEVAITPPPLRPAVNPALVEAWAMTSLESHMGRPDIQPWLRGWVDEDTQTEIVWRRWIPIRRDSAEGTAIPKLEIERFFEAAPPHTSEVLETETFRVVAWLSARAKALQSKHAVHHLSNGGTGSRAAAGIVLSKGGKLKRILRVQDLAGDKLEREELQLLLANSTLVLDARIAGLKDGVLNDSESYPPRTADDGQPWVPNLGFRLSVAAAGEMRRREPNWRESFRFATEISDDSDPLCWLVVEKWRDCSANEDDRSEGVAQLLEKHREWAETCAREFAAKLSLPDQYVEMLCAAAFLHDEGKCSGRWQAAFNAPRDNVYAKTEGPINYALLDHYRHELGSVLAAKEHERIKALPHDLKDLALHLIAAHHGFARPFIETRACDSAPPSVLEVEAGKIALRFSELQQRWGAWGLAWWESLLRSSDQQASRQNDARASRSVVAVRSGAM